MYARQFGWTFSSGSVSDSSSFGLTLGSVAAFLESMLKILRCVIFLEIRDLMLEVRAGSTATFAEDEVQPIVANRRKSGGSLWNLLRLSKASWMSAC
jgi:hypothetical protein